MNFHGLGLTRKWPRAAAICYRINDSIMLVCMLDDFLCITIAFLGFTGYLFAETFDLLLLAADQFPSLFLHFAGNVFCNAFDLIFVHYHIPSSKLTGSPCGDIRLNVIIPP